MVVQLILAAEQTSNMPPPLAVGATAFVSLLIMLLAVLMYGKGRPHT